MSHQTYPQGLHARGTTTVSSIDTLINRKAVHARPGLWDFLCEVFGFAHVVMWSSMVIENTKAHRPIPLPWSLEPLPCPRPRGAWESARREGYDGAQVQQSRRRTATPQGPQVQTVVRRPPVGGGTPRPRGMHSLLYFAYTCVRDLFIWGVFTLQEGL